MRNFAEILVNEKILTYAIPENIPAQVGQQINVPLRQKSTTGYLIRFVEQPAFTAKPILGIADTTCHFTEKAVTLALWISDYYKCFPETALKNILPKGGALTPQG